MVHNRDHGGVGITCGPQNNTKNQPQFPQMTIGQYWLGKSKPKQAFRSI